MKRKVESIKTLPVITFPNQVVLPHTMSTQGSDSSRAFYASKEYDSLILEKIKDSTNLLFRHSCALLPEELVWKILFNYHLKDILTLRLVSTGCYHLASIVNTYLTHSILSSKGTIPFSYIELFPSIKLSQQEKFEFAKKNTQVKVTISCNDLLNALDAELSILHSIPQNGLKIILSLYSIDEVNRLNQALLSSQLLTKFINNIVAIDLARVAITAATMDPINALLQSLNSLPNLTMLNLGPIAPHTTLNLSKYSLPDLTTLTLEAVAANVTLNLSNCSFPCLTVLTLGDIAEGATVSLPVSLPNLTTLTLEDIFPNAMINLSNCSFPNLKTLTLKDIFPNVTVNLPNSLLNLTKLTLDDICPDATIDLSNCSFPNLTMLTLGNISRGATVKLPVSLTSLTTLTFEFIYPDTTVNLSNCSLPNLKTLTFGDIAPSAMIGLPNSLPNLITLSFGKIYHETFLELPESLGAETTLKITEIGDYVKIKLPEAFYDQIDSFKKIGNNVAFILPTGTFYHHTNF